MHLSALPPVAWGFTTQNFLEFIPPSVGSIRSFLSEAHAMGLQWLELRDPNATLSLEACRELAAFADTLDLEVNYSAQRGLLAEDLDAILPKAIANTACFQGPRTLRILALRGSQDKGWSEDEFKRVLDKAHDAASLAARQGVSLSIENADVPLLGKPGVYRGMDDLFAKLDGSIHWQLDTANLFLGPVAVSADEAAAFIRQFGERVSYLHLKTAGPKAALPTLADNPLDFGTIFNLLAAHKRIYAAIELASDKSPEAIKENFQNGLQYLREKGYRT
jgi:sugar phosphate isomerase/epimerase